MADKPKFDPNKPFKAIEESKPAFDPNKPYVDAALKKKEPTVSESPSPDGTSPSQDQHRYVWGADLYDPLEISRVSGQEEINQVVRGNERVFGAPSPSSSPLSQDAMGASLSGTDMAQTVPPQSPQTAPAQTQEGGVESQPPSFIINIPKKNTAINGLGYVYGGTPSGKETPSDFVPENAPSSSNTFQKYISEEQKKGAAYRNIINKNYDVASQILKTVNDDTDGYVYELQAYIDERNGNVKQSQQNLKQAVNLAPNNLRLYPQLATISYKAGDIATATQAADKYIAEAGVAGGDKEKAEGLATSYAIKGDKEKSDYWHKTKLQIEEFERQQGLANTLKSMPDYLIHESIPGRLATGGFSTIGLGVDNIVNAIRGEETVNGETKPLTSFERLVTGFIGVSEVGMGAGMYTPMGKGLFDAVPAATRMGKAGQFAGSFVFPSMLEFNAALIGAEQILPSDIYKWVAAPVSSAVESAGIAPEELSKLQQLGVQYGDMVGLILASKAAKAVYHKVKNTVAPEGVPQDPVYVYWANRAYEKIKNREPLEPQEAKVIYDAVENLSPEDIAEMSTMVGIYEKAKATEEQLKQYQEEAPEPTYRVNNELVKSPDEVVAKVEELQAAGADPESIQVDVRKDPTAQESIVEKLRALKKEPEPAPTPAEPTIDTPKISDAQWAKDVLVGGDKELHDEFFYTTSDLLQQRANQVLENTKKNNPNISDEKVEQSFYNKPVSSIVGMATGNTANRLDKMWFDATGEKRTDVAVKITAREFAEKTGYDFIKGTKPEGNGNLTEYKPAATKPQEATPTETKAEAAPQPEAVKAEPTKSDGKGSDKVSTPKPTTNEKETQEGKGLLSTPEEKAPAVEVKTETAGKKTQGKSKSSTLTVLDKDTDLIGDKKETVMRTLPELTKFFIDREKAYIKGLINDLKPQEKSNTAYVNEMSIKIGGIAKFGSVKRQLQELRLKLKDIDVKESKNKYYENLAKWQIEEASQDGSFAKYISEGRMTPKDAITIIESAGLEVPKDIRDMVKEKAPVETKAAIDEINALPLTRVRGINMDSDVGALPGTFLSTEPNNRYALNKEGKYDKSMEVPAKVTVKNPFVIDTPESMAKAYSDRGIKDNGTKRNRNKLIAQLEKEGYDAVHFKASDKQEGELYVMDRKNVKFEEKEPPLTKEQLQERHNRLVRMVSSYNNSDKNSRKKTGTAKISNLASQLGYAVKGGFDGKIIVEKEGKPIKKWNTARTKEELESHKSLSDYSKDFQEFVDEATAGLKSLSQLDLSMSAEERARAITDLQNGKKSAVANDVLDKLEGMFQVGRMDVIDGTGGSAVRQSIPIEEIMRRRKETAEQAQEIVKNELPSQFDSILDDLGIDPEKATFAEMLAIVEANKGMFEGFSFNEKDYNDIKTFLTNAEKEANTKRDSGTKVSEDKGSKPTAGKLEQALNDKIQRIDEQIVQLEKDKKKEADRVAKENANPELNLEVANKGELIGAEKANIKGNVQDFDGQIRKLKEERAYLESTRESTRQADNAQGDLFDKAIDFLDTLKVDTKGKAFDATLGIPIVLWNGSIDVIRASIKAGKAVADAITDAIDYIKRSHPNFDEAKYRQLYEDAFTKQEDKLRQDVAATLGKQFENIEVDFFGSKTATDADFKNPTGFFKKATGIVSKTEEATVGKMTDALSDGIAKLAGKAVESTNQPLRVLGKAMNSLFQNITRSISDVARKERFIGESKDRNIADAVTINKKLREIIKNDPESLKRIDQVIDPDFYRERTRQEFEEMISSRPGFEKLKSDGIDLMYEEYRKAMGFDEPGYEAITYDKLAPHERAVADAITTIYDFIHDANFVMGKIKLDTYIQNKGKYSARLYDAFEFPQEINEAFVAGTKMQTGMYKEKDTDLDTWKLQHKIDDPVHSVTKRLFQTMLNKGVFDYSRWILTHKPSWVAKEEMAGYTKLGNGYGELSNKFVRDDIAEDFKGFFFTTKTLQSIYEGIKGYSRWNPEKWYLKPVSRQFYRKLFTEWNPAVQVGNLTGNVVFSAWLGISPARFTTNFVKAVNHVKDYSSTYRYLLSKGVLNSDLTRADLINGRETYDQMLADAAGAKNPFKAAAKLPGKIYKINDDLAKIAAFESLTQMGIKPEKALNRIADSFQNFKRVGKAYDVFSQVPVFGNMFGRWGGDLFRIVKSGVTRRPMQLVAFGATLQLLAYLASSLSGETDEEKKIREQRVGAPKIPMPDFLGGDIPLTWKIGKDELNIARFISPLYLYSTPDQDDVYELFQKFSPVPVNLPERTSNPGGRWAAILGSNVRDPVLAPLAQLIFNSDFKGAPIIDPSESIYKQSQLTSQEKIVNAMRFLGRGYVPYGSYADDIVRAMMGQQDYYGRDRSVVQIMTRFLGYNTQQFGSERYKKVIENEFRQIQLRHDKNMAVIKDIRKAYGEGKISIETAQKRMAVRLEIETQIKKDLDKLREKGLPFVDPDKVKVDN